MSKPKNNVNAGMKEIGFWFFLGATLILSGCRGGKPDSQEERMQMVDARPNIVLIMADDMGHEVLGSYGGTGSVDHPSPEGDKPGSLQKSKALTWSTRAGPMWSGGPVFPCRNPVAFYMIYRSKLIRYA